jgi:hypothetical protein
MWGCTHKADSGFTRFQVAPVNTEDRLLALFRQVKDARAVTTILLLALDRYRGENFRLIAFWETVTVLHR